MKDYSNYKGFKEFPTGIKGDMIPLLKVLQILHSTDQEWRNKLRYVRIYFDTPTFDRITKDRAAKFVDYVSVIGGTMGLLSGFSIISLIEILYFIIKGFSSFTKK